MKKTIRLTESELHGLIKECIEEIIYENRGPLTEAFQSKDLAKRIQRHGGIDKNKTSPVIKRFLNDLQDDDIRGEGPMEAFEEVKKIKGLYDYPIVCKDGTVIGLDKNIVYYRTTGVNKAIRRAKEFRKELNGRPIVNRANAFDKNGDPLNLHFQNPYAAEYINSKYADKSTLKKARDLMSQYKGGKMDDADSERMHDLGQKHNYYSNKAKKSKEQMYPWHDQKMAQGPNPVFK